MNILEMIQKYGVEFVGRFYSSYKAIVVKNDDPENIGRIYVWIPSIHNGIKVWARPKSMPGSINSGIKWVLPRTGEIVRVEFESGDPLKPLWSYHGWAIGEVPEELRDNDSVGLVTPNGNKIYLQDKDGILNITTNSKININIKDGTSISMDSDVVSVNEGKNFGVINIEKFKSFVEAVLKDLLVVPSGQNVSKWMAEDLPDLEDKKFTH